MEARCPWRLARVEQSLCRPLPVRINNAAFNSTNTGEQQWSNDSELVLGHQLQTIHNSAKSISLHIKRGNRIPENPSGSERRKAISNLRVRVSGFRQPCPFHRSFQGGNALFNAENYETWSVRCGPVAAIEFDFRRTAALGAQSEQKP